MVNYSIIVPHKNIPDLLQRCMDSIPNRDDIQVIVVDDNSDPQIVDFDSFPGLERTNVEVVFTKEGKGAGYARNVGLDYAKGKWLLFLDSDDFLSDQASAIFDKVIDSPHDMVFCDKVSVMSDDLSQCSDRDSAYHNYIQDFLSGHGKEDYLRYCFHPMWGKIIRHSLVQSHQIRFDEVRWSNDEYFSSKVGFFSKSIGVLGDVLFVITQRPGSLTSNLCGSKEEFKVRLEEAIKSELFLSKHGVQPEKLQSNYLLRYYYNNQGKMDFFLALFSCGFLSKKQMIMIKFLLRVLKEKLVRI